MPRRIALLAFVCCSLSLGLTRAPATRVSAQVFGRTLARPILASDDAWPELAGRVGPYGGIATGSDASQMLGDGLSLAVVAGMSADAATVLRNGAARYIDTRPWSRIYAVCQQQYAVADANKQPRTCALTAADEAAIAAQVSDDLRRSEGDAALAGFWILDDDPHGDVTSILARIHALVDDSNGRSHFRRPTICGVGGTLDHKARADDATFAPDRQAMVQALRNVSPAACDLVTPYFYGVASADDPSLVDWTLKDLLPFFQLTLKGRGYISPIDVMLPLVDAFSFHSPGNPGYYVKPRAADVTAQMHAYCDAGAMAVLFFTWRSADADRSYANDDDLRAGVLRGQTDCRLQWRKQHRQ